jgi:hypothetical protein
MEIVGRSVALVVFYRSGQVLKIQPRARGYREHQMLQEIHAATLGPGRAFLQGCIGLVAGQLVFAQLSKCPAAGDHLHMFQCISAGVAALHAAGYIHTDISPDNIMFNGTDYVLIDFGAARAAGRYSGLVGKPGHRAPEIPRAWGAPVDVFATTTCYLQAVGLPTDPRGWGLVAWEDLRPSTAHAAIIYGCYRVGVSGLSYDVLRAVAGGLMVEKNRICAATLAKLAQLG